MTLAPVALIAVRWGDFNRDHLARRVCPGCDAGGCEPSGAQRRIAPSRFYLP
ncbi:MAG: hypothetical protein WCJ63_00625 [Actinomycetes bacterium]